MEFSACSKATLFRGSWVQAGMLFIDTTLCMSFSAVALVNQIKIVWHYK